MKEISVNILAVENKEIYICRKGRDYNRIVNLMLKANVENPNKKHYVAVKSLSRLLSKQNSKHKEAQHFCTNCLNGFESEIIRDEHYEYCRSKDSVRVEMPTKNPIVKYADGQYQFKVPFVIYADFESILVPVSGAPSNPEMPSTRGINVHQPSGWCMYSKFAYGKVTNPLKQYRGRDCVSKFCETIIAEAKRLYKSAPKKPMDKLTKEQTVEFLTAKDCHICFKKFSSKDRKVRDHCHYTGKYRGAAHSSCNSSCNIFVQFGGRLFRQVIGIPMGTNCAPLLADLFLYSYENEFLDNMIRSGHRRLARSFNLCYRYIDELIVFNNKKFLDYLKEIYPSQLTVEKTNKSDHLADYLDLTFIIDSGGKLSTRLYDKRDDFDFHIVNFPFLSSNIPSGPSYGVYISQLIRYARCCSHYDDFRYRHKCLVDRLLSQGYKALRLEKSFKKFYGRYQDLIERYRRSVNAMVSDSFPGQFLFNL